MDPDERNGKPMKIQQLIYFREVASELHFTRAAEKLFVSQSSLSHAIHQLEEELGVQLFLRKNGKKISLTHYGQVFLPFVIRGLQELEEGKLTLEHMTAPNSGTVSIAYTYINVCNIIVDLLDAFDVNPDNASISVRPIVNHGGRRFIEEALTLCDADLAFSCYDFAESKHVESIEIAEQQLFVALPMNHALAGKETIQPKELEHERLIMLTGSLHLHDWIVSMFQEEGLMPEYIDGCTDWTSQLMEVERGAGVAVLPKIAAQNQVAYVPLAHARSRRKLYLLWPSDRKLSKSAERFRAFCLDYFGKK